MRDRSLRAEFVARGVGLGALALILGALGFQYIGGIAPCEMCHWQRWPHIAAAIFGLVVVGFARDKARQLAWLCILLVLVSGLIGLYQSGMQWGILPGPSSCSGHRFILGSNMVPDVQCDVVTPDQIVFGLSLASYNAIFSLLVAVLAGAALLRGRR